MILKFEDIEKTGTDIVCESSFEFDGGKFESVRFSGRILPVGESESEFYLSGKLSALATLPCDRCLENVEVKLSGDVGVRILKKSDEKLPDEVELADDDVSAYTIDGEELDTDEITTQEALLLLPMKVTCDKPCGSELILDEEATEETADDPRWGVLNKLKNNGRS